MINQLNKGKACIGQTVYDNENNKGTIIDFFVENSKKSKVVIRYEDGTQHIREKYAVQKGTFRKPYLDDIEFCLQSGWQYISGFNNRYIISKNGEIKSAVGVNKGKILMPSVDSNGYQIIVLQTDVGKINRKLCRVHKLMVETFLHNLNEGEEINHINGNKY